MGIEMKWNDASRTLTLRLASGSRMLAPKHRNLEVKLGETSRKSAFRGKSGRASSFDLPVWPIENGGGRVEDFALTRRRTIA